MPEVIIQYKDKKNSSATIKDGKIILRITNRAPKSIQQQHINTLTSRLSKQLVTQTSTQNLQLITGSPISPFGLMPFWLDIIYSQCKQIRIKFQTNTPIIQVKAPTGTTSDQLKQKLMQKIIPQIKPLLIQHIHHLNQTTVQYKNLSKILIKNMSAKWGYCKATQGTICLAKKLFWCPKELVDYVIIHELCHFIHQNHSGHFWHEVAKYSPQYKKWDQDLINWQ